MLHTATSASPWRLRWRQSWSFTAVSLSIHDQSDSEINEFKSSESGRSTERRWEFRSVLVSVTWHVTSRVGIHRLLSEIVKIRFASERTRRNVAKWALLEETAGWYQRYMSGCSRSSLFEVDYSTSTFRSHPKPKWQSSAINHFFSLTAIPEQCVLTSSFLLSVSKQRLFIRDLLLNPTFNVSQVSKQQRRILC